MKKRMNYWLGMSLVILAGVSGWAIYQTINLAIGDLFLHFFGIENLYIQNLSIVVLVILIFWLVGIKGKKALNKILN
jgi:cellobiose-specific phosphotransferase system component IIC